MQRTPRAIFLPFITSYAAFMSDSLPFVHEPMTAWSIFIFSFAISSSVTVFSGRCGRAIVGLSLLKSMMISRSYSSARMSLVSVFSNFLFVRDFTYSRVTSSTGNMPFFAPASIAMLHTVKRSSIDSADTLPKNSSDA